MWVTMGWMETIWIGLEDLSRTPKIDTESIHWFNLLAYANWVADWNLNEEEDEVEPWSQG